MGLPCGWLWHIVKILSLHFLSFLLWFALIISFKYQALPLCGFLSCITMHIHLFFFKLLGLFLFIYLFIYGCVGSSLLCEGSPQLRQAGATPHRGAWASPHLGLSCCGAQAPDAQAQQPWPTGPVAPRHAGSSQTRARTRVPCTGRQTPNHCATREALILFYIIF